MSRPFKASHTSSRCVAILTRGPATQLASSAFAAGTINSLWRARSSHQRRQQLRRFAQLAAQGELAVEFAAAEGAARQLAACGQDADRDRQIEAAARLGQIGGR